jgi:hypothetical protein
MLLLRKEDTERRFVHGFRPVPATARADKRAGTVGKEMSRRGLKMLLGWTLRIAAYCAVMVPVGAHIGEDLSVVGLWAAITVVGLGALELTLLRWSDAWSGLKGLRDAASQRPSV